MKPEDAILRVFRWLCKINPNTKRLLLDEPLVPVAISLALAGPFAFELRLLQLATSANDPNTITLVAMPLFFLTVPFGMWTFLTVLSIFVRGIARDKGRDYVEGRG